MVAKCNTKINTAEGLCTHPPYGRIYKRSDLFMRLFDMSFAHFIGIFMSCFITLMTVELSPVIMNRTNVLKPANILLGSLSNQASKEPEVFNYTLKLRIFHH